MRLLGLFSDDFGTINSDEQLASTQSQFPFYDPAYICQAAVSTRKKTKEWMEELWVQYKPYADKSFPSSFKRQFTERAWELYLGVTLLNHGLILAPHKEEGPDFEIQDKNGKRICWIEAIAVKKGDGPDRVPQTVYNTVLNVPTEKIVLRLANGLETKFQKYLSDCKKGVVSGSDPYVIAIDRSELEHVDAMSPNILKALFGIGDLALHLRVNGKHVEKPERSWTHLPVIKKQSGQEISMHFFDNHEHAGISAVIYSMDSIINSPRNPKEMGENFFIIHNPNAINKLPDNFFPFGEEFKASNSHINKIRSKKDYTKPDPSEYLEQ